MFMPLVWTRRTCIDPSRRPRYGRYNNLYADDSASLCQVHQSTVWVESESSVHPFDLFFFLKKGRKKNLEDKIRLFPNLEHLR